MFSLWKTKLALVRKEMTPLCHFINIFAKEGQEMYLYGNIRWSVIFHFIKRCEIFYINQLRNFKMKDVFMLAI